jgi:transcriptional regulator with XRE-family HTH domain
MPAPAKPETARIRDVTQLGALCRAERKRRGLTLDDVHAATGLSTRFLSEFERGRRHVSVSRAMLALQSLGLDLVVVPRELADGES